jgi:hypothetical protein
MPTPFHLAVWQPHLSSPIAQFDRDEQARLFSLRITGKMRLWGIRDIETLRVLWWDPQHSVCPPLKK